MVRKRGQKSGGKTTKGLPGDFNTNKGPPKSIEAWKQDAGFGRDQRIEWLVECLNSDLKQSERTLGTDFGLGLIVHCQTSARSRLILGKHAQTKGVVCSFNMQSAKNRNSIKIN
jgi:hypothetical protein